MHLAALTTNWPGSFVPVTALSLPKALSHGGFGVSLRAGRGAVLCMVPEKKGAAPTASRLFGHLPHGSLALARNLLHCQARPGQPQVKEPAAESRLSDRQLAEHRRVCSGPLAMASQLRSHWHSKHKEKQAGLRVAFLLVKMFHRGLSVPSHLSQVSPVLLTQPAPKPH